MELPKFLLADNSDFEDAFVLHTEFPRFLVNVNTDEIEWFDDIDDEEADLENQVKDLLDDAYEFFEGEISAYEEDDFEEE
ncbi:Uncharacterised protein [Candidatus Ornithobacterium hominis]|uniref:Uncharacterized protein n=1 Tax=Candidatus Ornithobacterium hominis TaxID=2497989 RepID=A0A383TXW8_9FLAO|nr:hypothetical protein [Candidatus Ornithobacterium hominis]MCT7904017.1 hypothetical protein [Candidatus Ornithobacterium hominis]SZD72444.1 Uncharacterised protein [Candidatus Ornithobacterium hominis]SZD72731.1 Uncharacterised protein [Candidatus Ornithobacterium hominis]